MSVSETDGLLELKNISPIWQNVKPVFNVSKCTDLHSQLDCKLLLEMETSTPPPPPPLGT